MEKFETMRMVRGGLLALAMASFAACGGGGGSSISATPTGKVVKGPVAGAHVFDVNNVHFADTDATGSFPLSAPGPYHTLGGSYVPLDAQGNAGAPIPAPPLSAPTGCSQITPLSTLVASAAPADQAKILATLQSLGVTLDTDLSVKTTANTAALVLSESVGAMLQSASANAGANSAVTSSAVTSALISAVGSLPAGTISSPSAANLSSALSSAITSAALGNADLAALTPTLVSAANTAAQGAQSSPAGMLPAPPPTTGSTGSSGGTGGLQ